jgi:hypothetical protein
MQFWHDKLAKYYDSPKMLRLVYAMLAVGGSVGTATLIGRRHLLTASHSIAWNLGLLAGNSAPSNVWNTTMLDLVWWPMWGRKTELGVLWPQVQHAVMAYRKVEKSNSNQDIKLKDFSKDVAIVVLESEWIPQSGVGIGESLGFLGHSSWYPTVDWMDHVFGNLHDDLGWIGSSARFPTEAVPNPPRDVGVLEDDLATIRGTVIGQPWLHSGRYVKKDKKYFIAGGERPRPTLYTLNGGGYEGESGAGVATVAGDSWPPSICIGPFVGSSDNDTRAYVAGGKFFTSLLKTSIDRFP